MNERFDATKFGSISQFRGKNKQMAFVVYRTASYIVRLNGQPNLIPCVHFEGCVRVPLEPDRKDGITLFQNFINKGFNFL